MQPGAQLREYHEERHQLLAVITQALKSDPGVKAAWLFGSLGRGGDDALSDIDIWVIVDDDRIDSIIARPDLFAAKIDTPILCVEAPQNAPGGGAFLTTCYDAPVAPHLVDWYWQPQSLAYLPGQVRVLFDHGGLQRRETPMRFGGVPAKSDRAESPGHAIGGFWMMLMIAAKHAARAPHAERLEIIPYLVHAFVKVRRFLGQDGSFSTGDIPPHPLPHEKVQLLYQLAGQMCEYMAALAEAGEEVPAKITSGAYRYLTLIEAIMLDEAA